MESIGGDFFVSVLAEMVDFYSVINVALVDGTRSLILSLVFLYCLIQGWRVWFGHMSCFRDTVNVGVNVAVIVLAYQLVYGGHFHSLVYEPMWSVSLRAMTVIFNAAGGTGMNSFFTGIDAAFNGLFQSIEQLQDANTSWTFSVKIKITVAVLILALVFGLNYITFFLFVISSVVFFHIMMCVGGVVIVLGAFRPLRGLFFGWLKLSIFYALWAPFAAIVMGIMLKFLVDATAVMTRIDVAKGDVFTADYGLSVLMGVISLYVFAKIPEFINGILGTAGQGVSSGVGQALGAGAAGIGALVVGRNNLSNLGGIGQSAMNKGLLGGLASAGKSAASALSGAEPGAYSKSRGFDANGEKPE